jgi:hypothetical protein
MLKPDQNIMEMMFSEKGYFKLENDRQMSYSLSYRMKQPILMNLLKSLRIETDSVYNTVMGLMTILLRPIPPIKGYDDRKKLIQNLMGPLDGIFLSSEADYSQPWLQFIMRSTIYHWDLYGPYYPEVANKLSAYFHGTRTHEFILDIDKEFSHTLDQGVEPKDPVITYDIMKEIANLIYLEVFVVSQFKLGHTKVGDFYQAKAITILENITKIALDWLRTKNDDTLYLNYDYRVQSTSSDFNMNSSDASGKIFFLLFVAYKYHFEALASNPLTLNYNQDHGAKILSSLRLFAELMYRLAVKTDFGNNKFLSNHGTAFTLGILNPWLWYYKTLGSYNDSAKIIEYVEKMLHTFLKKVNPNRILENDPTKTMEGLLVHHVARYDWMYSWISQYSNKQPSFRNVDHLDVIYNKLIGSLALVKVQLQAGFANLARANLFMLLDSFELFTPQERNQILQLTDISSAFTLLQSPSHLPVGYAEENPKNMRIQVRLEEEWISFHYLADLIMMSVQAVPDHLGEIIEGVANYSDKPVKTRYTNIKVVHHRANDRTQNIGTPLYFVIFEIEDRGCSWTEVDVEQIDSEFITTGVASEPVKIYLLLDGSQTLTTGIGGRVVQMWKDLLALSVTAISCEEHLTIEEIQDIATNAVSSPQLFDSITIHLFDQTPPSQEFDSSLDPIKEFKHRSLPVQEIINRYLKHDHSQYSKFVAKKQRSEVVRQNKKTTKSVYGFQKGEIIQAQDLRKGMIVLFEDAKPKHKSLVMNINSVKILEKTLEVKFTTNSGQRKKGIFKKFHKFRIVGVV